ncbi:MAG: AarF/UbiB family protein [Campylobacterota bacterium]|nr:AarF/UbiB family protein [Campylobacterota bacterium]
MIKIYQSIENTKRLTQIVAILYKNGFNDVVKKINFDESFKLPVFHDLSKDNLTKSQRVKKTVEELGPTFIKLAQMLSTRPDLISLELVYEFEKLQDSVSPIDIDEIIPVFKEEFGKEQNEIFTEPLKLLATASIGQVYKSRLLNGDIVVVKVLKPKIDKVIKNDIDILKKIASVFDSAFVDYGINSILDIIKEFEGSIKNGLNFKLETMNLTRFETLFKDDDRIKVPKLYKEYSTNKIITMEFIDGIKVSDIEQLNQNGINTKEIAKKGFELLCEQIFKHRFFHADPHPGNIFITLDSKVSFIDFGMMGSISKKEQQILLELIYHLSQRDEEKASLDILNMTNYPDDIDTNSFTKDMSRVISTYMYANLKDINIKELFNDMTSLVSKHHISFKNDYYLFFKAITTIEGVGRNLDSNFNAVEQIKPIVMDFYKEQFLLKNIFKKVKELPKEIIDFLNYTPSDLKEIFKQMKSGRFKVELEHIGLQRMEESIEKSFNRLSLSIVIASILIGSALLLLAKTPPLIYNIPILGLAGFIVALIMSFILIISIFKKGRV